MHPTYIFALLLTVICAVTCEFENCPEDNNNEASSTQTRNTNGKTRRKRLAIGNKIDPISAKILMGEENGISTANLVPSSSTTLYLNQSQTKVYSLDYHWSKRFIFFTAKDQIWRDAVVGRLSRESPSKVVVAKEVDGPVSLAVDWVHGRLYWMSVNHQTVEAADLDGNNRTLLVDAITGVKYPNNIAVDPYAGDVFLVNNHSMFRMDLDGSNYTRLQLQGEDIRWVKCLTLDVCKRRIYYSGKEEDPDTGIPYIASCDYDGENCEDHPLSFRMTDIFSLDIFRDTLYFAHYRPGMPDRLYSVDMTRSQLTASRLQTLQPARGELYSIRVYHPDVQKRPKDKNRLERKEEQKHG